MEELYHQEQALLQTLQATRTRRRLSACFYTLVKLTKAHDYTLGCVQVEHPHV